MPQDVRDMYHYYTTMMEAWDGPAAILFSDGDLVGAILDRNGLRPVRYYVTDDGYLILSSEVGVLDVAPEHIVKKGHIRPGKMLVVDTAAGTLIEDAYSGKYDPADYVDAVNKACEERGILGRMMFLERGQWYEFSTGVTKL